MQLQQSQNRTDVAVERNGHSKDTIYEIGVKELERVSQDDAARRQVDSDLNEARGRDGARLHVTLKAVTEADRRNADYVRQLEARIQQLEVRLSGFSAEIQDVRTSLSHQGEATLQATTSHVQESTNRLAVDVRKLRDEIVSLVDSRMNQADASFAAIRGDVEVVKYLVMDLIKDRISRIDTKPRGL